MQLKQRRQGFRTNLPPMGEYDEPYPGFLQEAGGGGGAGLLDSFPSSMQNDNNSYGIQTSLTACYQSFTASKAAKLSSVKFSLVRKGACVGNIVATLYASTGVMGSDAKPTGTPLATSDPIDATTIALQGAPDVAVLYEFQFTGANQFQLVAGADYCIAFEKDDQTGFPSPEQLNAGLYFGNGPDDPGTHYGNAGYLQFGVWGSDDYADTIFYLYAQ